MRLPAAQATERAGMAAGVRSLSGALLPPGRVRIARHTAPAPENITKHCLYRPGAGRAV